MEKSKLGVSVAIAGAALYFLGILSIIPLVLLAGYVLLREDNTWLKKTAVKAVGIVIFFGIIGAIIGMVGDAQSFLYDFMALCRISFNFNIIGEMANAARDALNVAESLVLLMCGFKALSQNDAGFGPVDNVIEKHT